MTGVSGEWLTNPKTQHVLGMLEAGGYEAYVVGGCVRNALLDVPVTDVDISTNAKPDAVIALAEADGLRSIPTGIDHGTVTVLIDDEPFEITTFRADVETDGRRAVVRFAETLEQDAVRRDFTMNALYADRCGKLFDPLGGLPDLKQRLFRFIENAETRIQEDYLRTLRYFRFSAWYGDPDAGMDPDALAAIADNLEGLDTLSRERVGSEVRKLLAAPDPVMAVSVMDQTGVLQRVLPGACVRPLGPLTVHERTLGLMPDPLRRLASIGFWDGAALRFSKAQTSKLGLYQRLIESSQGLAEIAWRDGSDTAFDIAALRAAMFESPLDPATAAHIAEGSQACFPVSSADLKDDFQGPALGARLRALRAAWIASGFAMTKAELLALPAQPDSEG
ncbi:CCA tRNA nucleotidyltransferase [Thalassococcus lentus]|uniref:CCA tRNA nucleotidyltransferase n=1 Tax=Thalassococcus lentus TaxID=1210524 RepID=A0ABT4XNA6_9RHOB|nr:CCA tRNA nucleotidyltransferase [Thalassococcus lentus]MDA7423427.1 CCA tRNA nucleotidyltransferase [Thalassococcus lentus]